jgi:hypothetical protein
MAVAIVMEMPGFGTEVYDAVNEKMNVNDDPPAGLICHTAGHTADGTWRIFDVWESQEAYDRFSDERLGPAINEVTQGQAPAGEPRQDSYELHNVISP